MDRGLAVLLTAVVGGILALQAPINAGLGPRHREPRRRARVFHGGDPCARAVVAVSGEASGLIDLRGSLVLPGRGLLGAVYVTMALITVRSIGAGGVAAATITGQLTTALLIDRLGLLGLQQTSSERSRILGVALLFAGTYLVIR